MTIRHDARLCRQKASSEVIRIGLGILTPQERRARQEAQERRELASRKEAQRGPSLFSEDGDA